MPPGQVIDWSVFGDDQKQLYMRGSVPAIINPTTHDAGRAHHPLNTTMDDANAMRIGNRNDRVF